MVHMRLRPLRCRLLPLFLLLALAATAFAESEPPAAQDAAAYPAVDVHSKEKVAIAAVPFDTKEKCKFLPVNFLDYGFMPIRIIVTNNGDRPISLRDARIDFMSSAGDKIPAAEPDDVERRISGKNKRGMDIPVGPIKIHTKAKDSDAKIEQAFDHYEYSSLVVDPHSTRAGFLFYDMMGLGNDPLHGSKLVLRELKDADGNQLFYFEIPFDKYLTAARH